MSDSWVAKLGLSRKVEDCQTIMEVKKGKIILNIILTNIFECIKTKNPQFHHDWNVVTILFIRK